jgi:hypothetical protein
MEQSRKVLLTPQNLLDITLRLAVRNLAPISQEVLIPLIDLGIPVSDIKAS